MLKVKLKNEMDKKYILNEQGEPVVENDFEKWAEDLDNPARLVKEEKVGNAIIETTFQGFDILPNDNPVLWKTVVFGGIYDYKTITCEGSREQAEAMHRKAVRMVKKTKPT